MQKDYLHISVLLDRSGSMSNRTSGVINGFNEFLKSQKNADGKCTISLAQFDYEYESLYNFENVGEIPERNSENYKPRGSTALYSSIEKLMDDTGTSLKNMKEEDRPSKVMLVIQTDGLNNHYDGPTLKQIQKKIKHQEEKYNWEIVYLGDSLDQIKEAQNMGMNFNKTVQYGQGSKGMESGYEALTNATLNMRADMAVCCDSSEVSRSVSFKFSDEDKKIALNEN